MKEFLKKELYSFRAVAAILARWLLLAVPTGLVCGAVGTAFHLAVEHVTEWRAEHIWLLWLLPVAGLAIVALYKVTGCEGMGTNNVIRAVHSGESVSPLLVPAIFFGTVLTHLCGGSAGREGAALQMGGSIGYNIAKLFRFSDHDRRTATACGMAAFFSALFGTPLSATLFGIMVEDVGLAFSVAFVPGFAAALIAYGVSLACGISPTHFELTAPALSIDSTPVSYTHLRTSPPSTASTTSSATASDPATSLPRRPHLCASVSPTAAVIPSTASSLSLIHILADSMHAVSDAMTEILGTTALDMDQKMDESRLQLKLAAAEARDSYDKLSPREAASTMRTRADEAMEAARRASQTARLNAAEAAKAVKLAAQGKAEQTTAFLQLEQLKEELAARAQVMQARTRRGTHLLGKGRMLRAYPKLKHGQSNRSLSSLLEQLEDEYPDSFNGFGIQ